MANEVSMSRLLGFQDFFPGEKPQPKEYYAKHAGKDLIETFCCFFLGYFRHGAIPAIPQLLQNWFTFMGRPYFSSPSYWHVITQYARIRREHPGESHSILSEESLLNLFLWTKKNLDIPGKVEPIDASVMLHMFILNLLFNDDVLNNYQKAVDSAKKYDNRMLQRMFLATSFPQSDIINVDYAQLMYTQFYKLMLLLDFLEATPEYQPLFKHLLDDFSCNSKAEFLKAIAGAVFTSFKGQNPGWSALTVDKANDVGKSKSFLDKLTLSDAEASTDQNDYLPLRDKPFQKLDGGEYRIVFDLFLVKKLYNGIIFKLSDYSNKDDKLIKGFLGKIRDDFSEAVLVYDTLAKVFHPTGAVVKTGNEFKAAKVEREPDFYARIDNSIVLFESKDFYMPGASKLSYDFDTIEGELKKDGRLGKAVKQLKKNIERTIAKRLILDTAYDPAQAKIYPVIIVHDSLYSSPSLNYWVNSWLTDEIAALKAANTFPGFDYTRIMPVTLVEVDTLILYLHHFQTKQFDLISLMDLYHQHVRLDLQGQDADNHIFQSVLPFSEFVREYGYTIGVTLNMDILKKLYKDYGIQ
jgi:hypothetical protein